MSVTDLIEENYNLSKRLEEERERTGKLEAEIAKLVDERKRIDRNAVMEERDMCARTALSRMRLYEDLGQQNVCKEIYSSILCRSDS